MNIEYREPTKYEMNEMNYGELARFVEQAERHIEDVS